MIYFCHCTLKSWQIYHPQFCDAFQFMLFNIHFSHVDPKVSTVYPLQRKNHIQWRIKFLSFLHFLAKKNNQIIGWLPPLDILDPPLPLTYDHFNLDAASVYKYRSGTVNSNTVNSKFHFIRTFCEMFSYHFPIIWCLKRMVNSYFHLFRRKSLPTKNFELTVPNLQLIYAVNVIMNILCNIHGNWTCKTDHILLDCVIFGLEYLTALLAMYFWWALPIMLLTY